MKILFNFLIGIKNKFPIYLQYISLFTFIVSVFASKWYYDVFKIYSYKGLSIVLPQLFLMVLAIGFTIVAFLFLVAQFVSTDMLIGKNNTIVTLITLFVMCYFGKSHLNMFNAIRNSNGYFSYESSIAVSYIIFSSVFLSFIIVVSYFIRELKSILNKESIVDKIILILILGGVLSLSIYYGYNDNWLHIYDMTGYWINTASVSSLEIPWSSALSDMMFQEYRTIQTIPISFLMKVFGTHRRVFIILSMLFYYIPTILSIAVFIKKNIWENAPLYLIVSFSFLIPLFISNILIGLPQVFILFFISIGLIAYFNQKNDNIILTAIVIANSIFLAFTVKRWGIYISIGLCVLIFMDVIYKLKTHSKKDFISIMIPPTIIAISIIINFLVINPIKTIASIFNSYSSSYSAYKESLYATMISTVNSIGIIPIMLSIFTLIYCFFVKNVKTKKYVFYFLGMFISSYFLFYKIQSPDIHHMMLFAYPILLIVYVFLSEIDRRINFSKTSKKLIACILVISILPTFKPQRIGLFSKMTELYELFESYAGITYIIACHGIGSIATYDAIRAYNKYNDLGLTINEDLSARANHIDLRDGIPFSLLEADTVVNTTEIRQCEANQYVISYPHSLFKNNIGIAKAFNLVKEISIDGEDIQIYKKYREISEAEKQEFISFFQEIYTQFKESNPL